MENMWLQTDAKGLGGVWLGTAPNEERMQQNRFEENRMHFVD